MSAFPKFTYFRILGNKSREAKHLSIDIPLSLFIYFSKISTGISICSGFFILLNKNTEIARTGILISFILITLAIISSMGHLTDLTGVLRMFRNLRSPLTQEILLTSVYSLTLAAVYMSQLFLKAQTLQGFLLMFSALLLLLFQVRAHFYISHPVWNSNLLYFIYILSSILIGVIILFTLLVFTGIYYPLASHIIVVLTCIALIVTQTFVLTLFKDYIEINANPAFLELTDRKFKKFSGSYIFFTLIFPAISLFSSLVFFNFIKTIFIFSLIGLLIGNFIERIIFFKLENPVFFFTEKAARKTQ